MFHVQLLRNAYPDGTNIETGAAACNRQPIVDGRMIFRGGNGIDCYNLREGG